MTFEAPPAALAGPVSQTVLPAGTVLLRVHPTNSPAEQFDFPKASVFGGGGRFDATPDSGFRTLCASMAPETAIAERFLKEFAATPGVRRVLLRNSLLGNALSTLRTTGDLALIRLTSAQDLAAVHQDSMLITSRPDTFPATREWAAWLHDQVPWAQGILWQSVADMPRHTVVLFDDRDAGVALRQDGDIPPRRLDAPEQASWLADLLEPYGVRTDTPVPANPRFFVNYRTGDGDVASRMLHNELSRRFGERQVFRAGVSIPVGTANFEDVLLPAVRGCKALLAVVGRSWEWTKDRAGNLLLDDVQDWVRREVLEARGRGALVVPIIVGTRMRLRADDLPEALRFLSNSQFLHLPHGFGENEVASLVDRLLKDNPDLG
ncbi:RES family NAD+ phosphorylase [Umezawaea sp. NPDC059074]|uniref:RES family NAD+ phosphorylase n=1 Tax=Umezawaea sp. NPDC059074 TaxID=3346716 RepID=UPI00368B9A51